MRHIAKFSDKTKDQLASLLSVDPRLIHIALGKYLADTMALPNAPIENIAELYKNSFQTANFDTLIYIAEILPIDFKTVDEKTEVFWKDRYSILHDIYYKIPTQDTYSLFLGITNKCISKEELLFIQEHSADLCRIYNKFLDIVTDIKNRIVEARK